MPKPAQPGWRVTARRFAWFAALVAVCGLVAACADPGEAYLEAQSSIKSTLDSEHMPVASVSCQPHAGQLEWTDPPAHIHCRVKFKNGTSYTTPATIQPVVDQPDAISWDGPPDNRGVVDLTKAPLPVPTSSLPATSPQSLFTASNLSRVVAQLNRRFRNQSVVQLAIYPGELQTVIIIGSQNEARLITSRPNGTLKVGPALPFNGDRLAIYPSQISASVVQALATLIGQKGGVPLKRLSRFVMAIHGSTAGWDIYPISGRIRFEAPLTGGTLTVVTAKGRKTVS